MTIRYLLDDFVSMIYCVCVLMCLSVYVGIIEDECYDLMDLKHIYIYKHEHN